MKISIIIVSYNVKEYVSQCIRSIYKSDLNKKYNEKIITNISPKKNYCKAEEYHQKYI